VITPIEGMSGEPGGDGIITFGEGDERHPSADVTVKL